MFVSPVDLNTCGPCYYQPLIDNHRSDKTTLFDDIRGESTDISNPAERLFNTIKKLNQNGYGSRDKITNDPAFVNPSLISSLVSVCWEKYLCVSFIPSNSCCPIKAMVYSLPPLPVLNVVIRTWIWASFRSLT